MAATWNFIENNPALEGLHNAMEQGADFDESFTWRDENDSIIDLSGYSARMKIRKSPDSSAVIASYTDATEITLASTDPNITIFVAGATTAGYDWTGYAVYDLELVSAGGLIYRVLQGKIELSREVTK